MWATLLGVVVPSLAAFCILFDIKTRLQAGEFDAELYSKFLLI